MNIVIGTDFSPVAQQAADAAAAIASATDGHMTLVHVHQTLAIPDAPELTAQAAEDAVKALSKEADRIRKTGVDVAIDFPGGSAGRGLLEAAARHQADLLVVGSVSGRSLKTRWLLGDVAEFVAEHAQIPTLIVRNSAPIINWALKLEPLKILIGENLPEFSDNPLLWVKELSEIAPTKPVVAYVMWPYEEAVRYGCPLPISYMDVSPEVLEMAQRDLQKRTGRLMGDFPVQAVIKCSWGVADAPLAELTKEKKADLLVVGSRQHRRLARFLEHSVSRAVIHETTVNLAVVPCRTAASPRPVIRRFERVLIPTDFSEEGNRAIASGCSMVPPGGVVCIAHVCSQHQRHPDAEARLRLLIPPEAESFGIRSEVMATTDDNPAAGIVHLANRFGADAVCMANHPRPEIGEAFLRSTTREVLRNIRMPVLLVQAEGG